MRFAWIVIASVGAALLVVPARAQEPDAAAKLAELGKKTAAVKSLHLFGYMTATDRLDTGNPRVAEPSMIECWYDAATGNMRSDEVKERSVFTSLVNDAAAYVWRTRCGSAKPVGSVMRLDRAAFQPKKGEPSMSLGLTGFVLDARSEYSGVRNTFAVSLDTAKDEMGLGNVTWFVLTPDEKKNARFAREMKDGVFRIAVDNDSGFILCLRMESVKVRGVFTFSRIETDVDVKSALVLPPAVAAAPIVDANPPKPPEPPKP